MRVEEQSLAADSIEDDATAVSSQPQRALKAWQTELLFAAPVVGFVLYLFHLWFAVDNRYFIFLYFHNMGSGFDTTPFGPVTSSRYWMAGLVAAGAVMVPYVALNIVLGGVFRQFRAPMWGRLWLMCAIPLLIAIPLLVMTVNDPVLPPANAAQVTAVTLAGLALALAPGKLAGGRPLSLLWLLVDGLGLAILLVTLTRIDSIAAWLAHERVLWIVYSAILTAAGLALLTVTTAICWWRRRPPADTAAWLVSGFSIAYLLLPLCHYLFAGGSNGSIRFAYITDAANFFSGDGLIQIGIWCGVALLALGVTRLRQWLVNLRAVQPARTLG